MENNTKYVDWTHRIVFVIIGKHFLTFNIRLEYSES